MQQLTELGCLDFRERQRLPRTVPGIWRSLPVKLKAARAECHKVYNECKKAFDDLMLLRESSYDDTYKKCFQSFGRAISRNCGRNLLAAAPNRDTVAKFESETELLKQLLRDIRTPAEYVKKFHDRYYKRRKKAREELEQEVIASHHQMLERVQEKYPGIDLYKFALQVDSRSYWVELGQTPSVAMQRSDIDEEKTDKDLSHILKHYQDILKDIDEDAEWILKLVQQPVPAELPDSSEKSETSVCESQTEGNGFVHRRRNEQNPDFSAEEQPVPDKEGLSTEFKRIFTLHNRFARDIVDCRVLGETYHLDEEDVRDMLGNFQLELGALEHAVRKVIKSAPPDISAEDISRRVEVDDIEVVQAMIAKIQLDKANRPSPPQSEPKITEELPPLEPLSAWGAWRAQNFSSYFKIKQYLLDTYSREDGYKVEHQRLHAAISLNCHVSAVEACLREIEFEKSCESKACNWPRVLSAFDVIYAELGKIQWTDAEQAQIEKVSDDLVESLREYHLTKETRLAVLAKVMLSLMKQLDDKTAPAGEVS